MVTATEKVGCEQHLLLLQRDASVRFCVQEQTGVEAESIFQMRGVAQQLQYL